MLKENLVVTCYLRFIVPCFEWEKLFLVFSSNTETAGSSIVSSEHLNFTDDNGLTIKSLFQSFFIINFKNETTSLPAETI